MRVSTYGGAFPRVMLCGIRLGGDVRGEGLGIPSTHFWCHSGIFSTGHWFLVGVVDKGGMYKAGVACLFYFVLCSFWLVPGPDA